MGPWGRSAGAGRGLETSDERRIQDRGLQSDSRGTTSGTKGEGRASALAPAQAESARTWTPLHAPPSVSVGHHAPRQGQPLTPPPQAPLSRGSGKPTYPGPLRSPRAPWNGAHGRVAERHWR